MKENFEDSDRLANSVIGSLPQPTPDIIKWAEEHVVFPSSVRSSKFDCSITPWLREPIQRCADVDTRVVNLMKPVQSGGSVAGEVVILFWIMFWRGFLQYNWSTDKRADDRWVSRIEGIFKASISDAWDAAINKTTGEADFGRVFFRQQGAFNEDNLDSDSIPLQVNEEIHSWEPGHLKKAEGRSTAVWNFKRFNISNAGVKGDQLDQDHSKGTCQKWEVLCPGCKKFHYMRTRYEADRPDLGGLRYDAEGARVGKFQYNYNKIRPTIRYQFPCGYTVHNEDLIIRRALSGSGLYSEPNNENAELKHRSYTYQAVTVDYIDWMTLIQEKHDALRARSLGDPMPWIKYRCERECVPYDPNDVPVTNVITVKRGLKKNREGLPQPRIRFFNLDRQQGEMAAGDHPYWWLLIRDFKVDEDGLLSRLVFEDRVNSDETVIKILDEHECARHHGVADSGDDTTHVYIFCLANGINAIKGGKEEFYTHPNGARRIFAPERPLHSMIGRAPVFPYIELNVNGRVEVVPDPREPMFWFYSKNGVRERLMWLRANTRYETPDDVSEVYKSHQDAEERIIKLNPLDGTPKVVWVQHKTRNDQFVNECYAAMQADQAGLILENSKTQLIEGAKKQ